MSTFVSLVNLIITETTQMHWPVVVQSLAVQIMANL